jgi:hypothetical protein
MSKVCFGVVARITLHRRWLLGRVGIASGLLRSSFSSCGMIAPLLRGVELGPKLERM